MIIVGIMIDVVLDHFVKPVTAINMKSHFIFERMPFVSIFITCIVWEGNLRLDYLINKLFPWKAKPIKRIVIQFLISTVFSISIIFLSILAYDKFVCKMPHGSKNSFINLAMIVGFLVSITLLAVEVGTQFFLNWRQSLTEIEKYKKETLQAQLQNLKNQINPHFLFNNMSVLSSLVYKDQDKAVDFINQLSKVYRYLLDNKDCELVTLEEELTFIRSYTYLLQIRFDTNIIFKIDVAENTLRMLVPPMAIQVLVENVIKHNEISEELPLTVRIKSFEDHLEVSNNLQLRTGSEVSSKTGLKNIRDRYSYFTEKVIEVLQDSKAFIVKIPLLRAK